MTVLRNFQHDEMNSNKFMFNFFSFLEKSSEDGKSENEQVSYKLKCWNEN